MLKQYSNKEMFRKYPDVVTVDQLCKMLHIGKTSAYKLLRKKEIQSVKVGSKYLIPKQWIAEYFNRNND